MGLGCLGVELWFFDWKRRVQGLPRVAPIQSGGRSFPRSTEPRLERWCSLRSTLRTSPPRTQVVRFLKYRLASGKILSQACEELMDKSGGHF